MPVPIQILTTLEYLGPSPDHQKWRFGLLVQVAAVEGSPVSVDDAPLLKPWQWSAPKVHIWQWDGATGTPIPADAWVTAKPGDVLLGKVNDQFQNTFQDPNNHFFWTQPDNQNPNSQRPHGALQHPWPSQLAQMGRYAYPIPHQLQLAYLVTINAPTQGTIVPGQPPNTPRYLGAVSFGATVKVGGIEKLVQFTPDTLMPAPPKPGALIPGFSNRVLISYNVSGVTVSGITETIQAGPLAPGLPMPQVAAETEDWQSQLVTRVAEIFNLSNRLVRSVRQARVSLQDKIPPPTLPINDLDLNLVNTVAESFAVYVNAVVAAERDVVAYGSRVGPDNTSLLDRTLARWVRENTATATAMSEFATAMKQHCLKAYVTDRGNQDVFQQKWLVTLAGLPDFRSNSFLPMLPASIKPFVPTHKIKEITVPATPVKTGDYVLYQGQVFQALQDRGQPMPAQGSSGSAQIDAATPLAGAVWTQDWTTPLHLSVTPSIPINQVSDKLLAVEAMQHQFTDRDVLSRILVAQWTAASEGGIPEYNGDCSAFLAQFLGRAPDLLAELDVRGLLLRGNLDSVWDPIVRTSGGKTVQSIKRADLRTNMGTQFNARLKALFGDLPGTLACTGAEESCQLRDALVARLNQWLDKSIKDAVPDPDKPSKVAASGTAGLTLSLAADLHNDVDGLPESAGLLMLMRTAATQTAKPGPWRCLNYAYAMGKKSTGERVNLLQPSVAGPVVVPIPLHLQDGLQCSLITYNNQPQMAESPSHGFSRGLVPEPNNHMDRLVEYVHPSVEELLGDADYRKITGLAYGRAYDFYFEYIFRTGVLSDQVASMTDPGLLRMPADINVTPSISGVIYQRCTRVNALRFGERGTTAFGKIPWPVIPEDVAPYAQELGLLTPSQGEENARPLLLLNPYASTDSKNPAPVAPNPLQPTKKSAFTLPVHRPTTDLLTWDRWVAASDDGKNNHDVRTRRAYVWTAFHQQARTESTAAQIALEDPAVIGLQIDVVCNDSTCQAIFNADHSKSWAPPPILSQKLPTVPAEGQLAELPKSADPLQLQFFTTDTGHTVTVDNLLEGGWMITLPPGALATVTLKPLLDAKRKSYFAGDQLPEVTTYTLVVEAADLSLPQPAEVQSAFTILPPRVVLDENGKSSLDENVSFEIEFKPGRGRTVRAANLLTQSWRWDGRPLPQFPETAMHGCMQPATPPSKELLEWELKTFLNRTADDGTALPMIRNHRLVPPSSKGQLPQPDPRVRFTAAEDRSTEQGATYFRAGVTVYNRYGSLVPESYRSNSTNNLIYCRTSSSLDMNTASVPGGNGNWTRCYIPARIPDGYRVPKPAIKFIVPLTGTEGPVTSENTGGAPRACSVLVVVQGPWFAVGGLSEQMKVQITKAQAPNAEWLEQGPDPIVFRGSKADLKQFDFDSEGILSDAIGHTFDTSDAGPLWVNTSFILNPPKSGTDPAPAGTFARVQFRRVLAAPGVTRLPSPTPQKPHLGSPTPPAATVVPKQSPVKGGCSAADACSEWTDPVWVQFLPGLFSPFTVSMDAVKLDTTTEKGFVLLRSDKGTLTLSVDANSEDQHILFALLITEQVSDLVGRRGQERYKTLFFRTQNDADSHLARWKVPIDPKTTLQTVDLSSGNYIARILMIQRHAGKITDKATPFLSPDQLNEQKLWEELFGQLTPADSASAGAQQGEYVSARIVAISPPIGAMSLICPPPPSMKGN